jgi:hypothetical protein
MPGLWKINMMLATCGHQLETESGLQICFRYLMLLIALSRLASMTVVDVQLTLEEDEFTSFQVSDLSLYVFCISFHVLMMTNRKKMTLFLEKTKIVKDSSNKVKKRSTHLIIFFVIFYLLQQAFNTCDRAPYTACPWKRQHVFLDMERNVTQTDAIISGVVFAYDSILIMCWMAMAFVVHCFFKSVLEEFMKAKIRIMAQTKDKLEMFAAINSIGEAQSLFDSAFGFIPFLTFGVNFLQTSGYMLFAIYTTDPDMYLWRRCSMILVSYSYLIIPVLICMTAGVSRENRELAEEVIHKLEHSDMSDSDYRLIQLIEQVIDHKESGLLFDITSDTLLSYAGSILSFAIIFLQLFPNELSVSL